MRSPYMLDFPVSEYETRKKRLIEKLNEYGLDAIILTGKENCRYFTGFQSIVWDSKISTPAFVVVNSSGDWVMMGSKSSVGTMTITSCVDDDDLLFYDRASETKEIPDSYYGGIAKALEKMKVKGGKVGMELGAGFRLHMPFAAAQWLISHLTSIGAAAVDAAKLLWDIRSVKSEREIGVMRKVCEINCALYEAAFTAVEPGKTTERDLYRLMGIEAFTHGCDSILEMGIRAGIDRDPHTNCPSSERVIGSVHEREVLMIDGGPVYKGYYSDIIRTAVIGKMSGIQRERHDIAVEACYLGLSFLKPGNRVRQAAQAVDEFLDKKGFTPANRTRNWIGHGLGLDVHEYPCLELADDILKPGMVFACEPCICDEHGMFGIEENVLITENGYENLTPYRHDMIEIF